MTAAGLGPFVLAGGAWWFVGAAVVTFVVLLVWGCCRSAARGDRDPDEARPERAWGEYDEQIARAIDSALEEQAWMWPAGARRPERMS